jgi:hypothetical protein
MGVVLKNIGPRPIMGVINEAQLVKIDRRSLKTEQLLELVPSPCKSSQSL